MSLTAIAICLVVGIADGDTLTVRCGEEGQYQQVKIRLSAVDAPESGQAWGKRSKQHLSDLCYRVQAKVSPVDTDRYGRTVANVECRGQDAGLAQVSAGMAWFYARYGTGRSDISLAEGAARAARRGLWVDQDTATLPVAPWQWRKDAKAKAKISAPLG